ncbi:hypothetical protein PAXRUDRAFT_8528 [Paxillus rubicundulus Ve08.2h10]|uniref:Unplaced genomic scaffold scaffold_23, whole genome shotgun sequence n=1 Tax=Paxillus rubicundulus Ve08.2h10 TaxID=930991 RepID=A0A0D0DX10_9AGAM|nr:hypothetical protein PAXRUDRAFT_8528 [Paxillus rubicundulus Ve08.2h10]
MRPSILSASIILSALASFGLSAAIPTSSTATRPTPVAALWKNRIHEEVSPKPRTVDGLAPPETTSGSPEFDHLLEPAVRAVDGSVVDTSSTPAPAIWMERVHEQVSPTTGA